MVFRHRQGRRPGDRTELATERARDGTSPVCQILSRPPSVRHLGGHADFLRVTAGQDVRREVGSATTLREAKRCVYVDSVSWKPW